MNTPLTELQQFLGAYFNQDWTEEYSSADEVIDAFLTDSPKDIIIIVKNEILELINTSPDETDLQNNLLHKQHCYYYYPNQWSSGRSWLEHVVEKFSAFLQAAQH
jgi:hypothetical protein